MYNETCNDIQHILPKLTIDLKEYKYVAIILSTHYYMHVL